MNGSTCNSMREIAHNYFALLSMGNSHLEWGLLCHELLASIVYLVVKPILGWTTLLQFYCNEMACAVIINERKNTEWCMVPLYLHLFTGFISMGWTYIEPIFTQACLMVDSFVLWSSLRILVADGNIHTWSIYFNAYFTEPMNLRYTYLVCLYLFLSYF